MENTLFSTGNVASERVIYTPSSFAKNNLLYLQETGSLKALAPHVSRRDSLKSFLFFIVLSGSGEVGCAGESFSLKTGDCVFIDCAGPYYHKSSENLWTLKWVHFYGQNMKEIYAKYLQRGGGCTFSSVNFSRYELLLDEIFLISKSSDSVRDMKLCERIMALLTDIMADGSRPDGRPKPGKRKDINDILIYLDRNFQRKVSLDELAAEFYVNKYYLTRIFKEQTGQSISEYLMNKRITHAKALLRFSGKTLEKIAEESGMGDAGYFSKTFKKIEGITPGEYRKIW